VETDVEPLLADGRISLSEVGSVALCGGSRSSPALTCLWGIAQRRLRNRGGQNDATGVYDHITWGFIKYVWGYRRAMAPRVRALISEHAQHADVRVVTSRRLADRLLVQLNGDPDS